MHEGPGTAAGTVTDILRDPIRDLYEYDPILMSGSHHNSSAQLLVCNALTRLRPHVEIISRPQEI